MPVLPQPRTGFEQLDPFPEPTVSSDTPTSVPTQFSPPPPRSPAAPTEPTLESKKSKFKSSLIELLGGGTGYVYAALTPSVRLFMTVISHSGSFVSILGLLLTVLVAKNDIVLVITPIYILRENQAESFPGSGAWVAVVGSSGSLPTTLTFNHVPAKFPGFPRHIESEGAEAAIVVPSYFQSLKRETIPPIIRSTAV